MELQNTFSEFQKRSAPPKAKDDKFQDSFRKLKQNNGTIKHINIPGSSKALDEFEAYKRIQQYAAKYVKQKTGEIHGKPNTSLTNIHNLLRGLDEIESSQANRARTFLAQNYGMKL